VDAEASGDGCSDSFHYFVGMWVLHVSTLSNFKAFLNKLAEILDFFCFMMAQAASSGKFVDECLAMLTKQFFPPKSFQLPRGLTKKDQVLSRVHSALNDIADMLPLSPARLVPIVLAATPQYRFHDINVS